MSDSPAFDFGKFIPGFDFLQNLATSAKGPAGPVSALHNWVAPTVSVEELDKRIAELKAVLFWLEQNSTALKATIQALEVQKMTLATLQGMNLSMAEVAKAFTVATPAKPAAAPASEPAAPPHWPFAAAATPTVQPAAAPAEVEPEPEPEPEPPARAAAPARKTKTKAAAAAAPVTGAPALADPMQWWGALTQQFQQIAANAVREAARAAPELPKADATPPAAAGSAKAAARKSSSAKKVPARKPARKPATRKTAARAAKAASDPTPPAAETRGATLGWPLPPPFKLGR
ncbi:MAG TPA: hypothetical protein PK214_02520 [Ottowia sp.]|jgi:hypothetical protein|nr:MAG: hypothetical protein BGO36_15430 [Burkholderiales bacterium 68-10]HOK11239.1 hypothetical protein [Ottowia sp.]HOM19801.1 hypothetical protein [Ottowia sp.]HPP97589.1 hypothetical protein [Ottowia sp.]